jgi:hypothetical protein
MKPLFILAIALLVSLAGLGVAIGIATWSIRRASRYWGRKLTADHTAERAVRKQEELAGQMESLDEYASKISWLLNFLYNRYDKFADLEKEVEEGLKDVSGATPVGESDAKYKDLKKALKIIKVTVRVSERMGNLMNSITAQLGQIAEDFEDEDEEFESELESDKSSEAKADSETNETPNTGDPESKAPDAEVMNSDLLK